MIADRSPSARSARATAWQSPAGRAPSGGDWCDTFPLAEGKLAITIGDVCGHGEPVAAPMAAIRARVLAAMTAKHVPSTALADVNHFVYGYEPGLIVTAIAAVFDERERILTFANAGHPAPLLVNGQDCVFVGSLPGDLPLGVFAQHRAGDYVLALPCDVLVVFYTDGITEHARDPVAGEVELKSAARAVYDRPAVNAARAIARRVFQFGRGHDDAAAICLRTGNWEPAGRSV